MSTVQQAIKTAAGNKTNIPLSVALKIAEKFDQERQESKRLLRVCKQNTGMMDGESIEAHLAEMEGVKFSAKDYHYERLPGEQ